MNGVEITVAGASLVALGSGALHWPDQGLLCVSDLHLGKSLRRARLGDPLLPPYDSRDTLARLADDIALTRPRTVVCLGDSFDDLAAADDIADEVSAQISTLQAGRRWIWIEGNHDPGPVGFGGTHLTDLHIEPLVFRHIAMADAMGEVSGHYHPKATLAARGHRITRPAFLVDSQRVILPAYGTYTGGLHSHDAVFRDLMQPGALAILTGPTPRAMPMPR